MQLLPVNGDVKGLMTTGAVCTISWVIRTLGEHRYITHLSRVLTLPSAVSMLGWSEL